MININAPAGVGAPPLNAQLHSLTRVDEKDSTHYCASGHRSIIDLVASDSQGIRELKLENTT